MKIEINIDDNAGMAMLILTIVLVIITLIPRIINAVNSDENERGECKRRQLARCIAPAESQQAERWYCQTESKFPSIFQKIYMVEFIGTSPKTEKQKECLKNP